jgi:high-affinity Fe2+/Pb2+ permease
MKAYLLTTGALFAVIVVAHVFEVVDRQRIFASDVLIIVVSAGLSVWAWRLVRNPAA